MSSVIDLTGIFKPPPPTLTNANPSADKENAYVQAQPVENIEDMSAWVRNKLEMLDFRIKSSELTPNVVRCVQQLLIERQTLRQKCEELVDNCSQAHAQAEHSGKENELLENQVLILKQDLGVTQLQLESLQSEQREIKARFLQEKSELEQRCFQSQALETQHLASLRKVEKDFGKLQDQLQKLLRSSDKGRSASVQMNAPAPSDRTRATANVFVADRKEQLNISALRETNAMIIAENEKLRDLLGSIVEDFDALNARADELEKQLGAEDEASTASEEEKQPQSSQSQKGPGVIPPSPMVEIIDPRNKPLNWLREHLNGNMFKLRQRILAKAKPSTGENSGEYNNQLGAVTPGPSFARINPTSSNVKELQRKLRQTELVVIEQDKLISAALLSQLPISPNDGNANGGAEDAEITFAAREQMEIMDTKRRLEMEMEQLEEQKLRLKLASRNLSASASAKKASLVRQYDLEDLAGTKQKLGNMFDSPNGAPVPYEPIEPGSNRRLSFGELLPPVTPDTYAALRDAGLSNLPRMMPSRK